MKETFKFEVILHCEEGGAEELSINDIKAMMSMSLMRHLGIDDVEIALIERTVE